MTASDGARADPTANIQANLIHAAKRATEGEGKRPRDWLLFFFFRILDDAETEATKTRITAPGGPTAEETLWLDFAHPPLLHARRRGDETPSSAKAFRDWLKMVARADSKALLKQIRDLVQQLAPLVVPSEAPAAPTGEDQGGNALLTWVQRSFRDGKLTLKEVAEGLTLIDKLAAGEVADRMELLRICSMVGAPLGRLPILTLFEIFRQASLSIAHPGDPDQAAVRSEDAARRHPPGGRPLPVNVAFTFSGLKTLRLDPLTLASFPEPFREGMAARAARLHDTGPSDPVHWEGELGLPSIHGYFSAGGGFPQDHFNEAFWAEARRDVAAFNDPIDPRGERLRYWMSLLFRSLGMEIVHVELGQDPYTVGEDGGLADNGGIRVEHFGFRDGLSQPFVDLGLAPPPPGGGKPMANGTWDPVAPGEIFLDQRDETGATHLLPISAELRAGSTFLVFRKLEQDVAGFRDFLNRQRSSAADQETLAAQFMGRWPDGTALVLSPHRPLATTGGAATPLNDFRYAGSDPFGDKCPLGAHVRRTNPRDIGGRGEASRHRILRRSISYGGPLLGAGQSGQDERRGLLFVAANARIDVQFEVVQSEWMNGGEFLGQAGLGRCPISGANAGGQADSFLESGAVAPVTGLPRFVITRGGDYFFAPGVKALQDMASGVATFAAPGELPYDGHTQADVDTPSLFARDRMQTLGQSLVRGRRAYARAVATREVDADGTAITFIAKHEDVVKVLRDVNDEGVLEFSVRHYREAANLISGGDMLIGTDLEGETKEARGRLATILGKAWWALDKANRATGGQGLETLVRESLQAPLDAAIARTTDARRIDLVNDLASPAIYAVIARIFGVPGPATLTELAVALPFGRQHAADLPREWIAALAGARTGDPGQTTLQIWSVLILADLIGNLQSQGTLRGLARQAGEEMQEHITRLLKTAANSTVQTPTTLLDAMVHNAVNDPEIAALYANAADWRQRYDRDAAALLLEITGTSMATIPLTFASVMSALFDFRIDLASLAPLLDKAPPGPPLPTGQPTGFERLIYEAERLNPNMPVRMRYCETDTTLSNAAKIRRGEWVGCLIQAANLDPDAFVKPLQFSLSPFVDPNGPVRDWTKYLLFGDDGSKRKCWGRDKVAMIVLTECLRTAARLKRLRRPAGPGGKPRKMLNTVTIGLPARFARVVAREV